MNKLDNYDNILSAIGLTIGLTDIYNVLNIVLICLTILSIMLRAGISIYNKIKNKDIRGAVEETKQAIEQIKDIKEDLKNGQVQDNQD